MLCKNCTNKMIEVKKVYNHLLNKHYILHKCIICGTESEKSTTEPNVIKWSHKNGTIEWEGTSK